MSARVLAALFATFLFSACAQTQGETCQLDEDCEGDLMCCKLVMGSGTLAARGTCQTEAICRDMAAPEVDASIPDAGEDGGPSDAGPEQLGLGRPCVDAGGVCASGLECVRGICVLAEEPVDVDAGSDAGTSADGGTDAGQDAAVQDAGLDSGA